MTECAAIKCCGITTCVTAIRLPRHGEEHSLRVENRVCRFVLRAISTTSPIKHARLQVACLRPPRARLVIVGVNVANRN